MVTYRLECSPSPRFNGAIVDDHSDCLIWYIFHHFHGPFDGSTAPAVAPADNCPHPDWTVRYLLKLDIRIPTRVVTDVFVRIKVEYFSHWPVNHLCILKMG